MVTSCLSRTIGMLTLMFSLFFAGCAGSYEDEDVALTPTKDDETNTEKGGESGEEEEDGDFKDAASSSDSDSDSDVEGDLTSEDIPEEEDPSDEECAFEDCEEDQGSLALGQPAASSEPAVDSWTPNNNGPAPTPVRQADLKIDCTQLGAGLEPGYLRFGCKAYKQNGRHYGIVKGWWAINRNDGNRAKSKSLNFRESGYDMAFDVLESDASAGITVTPGAPPPNI